jgi:enoyl-CoA hydratase
MADRGNPEFREFLEVENHENADLLRLVSPDRTNRLSSACVRALTATLRGLRQGARPLVITGNHDFFSVGADLNEIASFTGPEAHKFSKMGQSLMNAITRFPGPVIAAIEGYCMGGGLDLALACSRRIATPGATFGHRGAVLGLITGWGGTQRLPRLIGKERALLMFVAAETLSGLQAFEFGLVDEVATDSVAVALARCAR